jgi:hypothetical protein
MQTRAAASSACAQPPPFARAGFLSPSPRAANSRSYGNAESNNHDDGRGTMEALNFGTANNSHWCMGAGAGPHVMVDLENGLWAGNCVGVNPQNTPLPYPFVTAMAKGGRPGGGFALKGGDATVAAGLKTMYEGFYPPRYNMKKQGAFARSRGPIRRRPPCRF